MDGSYRLSDSERSLIVDLYVRERKSIREVSIATSRSYGAVRCALLKANVQLKPRGSERGRKRSVA